MKFSGRSGRMFFLLFAIAITALAVVAFITFPKPFFITPVLLSIPFWMLSFNNVFSRLKVLWVNLAVILIIMACFEAVFILKERKAKIRELSVVIENGYVCVADSLLGWRLMANTSCITKKYVSNKLIYEAKVTIDSNSMRITPECIEPCRGAVLFFGNSCTYGEGVDDSLTLPYQFSTLTDNRYQVYNFGVYGYGPQQMLSQTQYGMVDSIVKGKVEHVVYQILYPEHLYRLCGFYSWNENCPRYIQNDSGEPVYAGNYSENPSRFIVPGGIAGSSAAMRALFTKEIKPDSSAKELLVAVILKSKKLLDEKYGNPVFHIILWDWSDGRDEYLFSKLRDEGIMIYDARDIFSHDPASLRYRISKHDTHPNGFAYRIIAEYLVDKLFVSKKN